MKETQYASLNNRSLTLVASTGKLLDGVMGYQGPQLVLFMQITTYTFKTKPNLQVKAKKTVCITSKLLLFRVFFFVGYA